MLRLDRNNLTVKTCKYVAEQYLFDLLQGSDVFEIYTQAGVEIYTDTDRYLIEPYIVIDDIEYYYGAFVYSLAEYEYLQVVADFVTALLKNEDYYLALHYKLPIQI